MKVWRGSAEISNQTPTKEHVAGYLPPPIFCGDRQPASHFVFTPGNQGKQASAQVYAAPTNYVCPLGPSRKNSNLSPHPSGCGRSRLHSRTLQIADGDHMRGKNTSALDRYFGSWLHSIEREHVSAKTQRATRHLLYAADLHATFSTPCAWPCSTDDTSPAHVKVQCRYIGKRTRVGRKVRASTTHHTAMQHAPRHDDE